MREPWLFRHFQEGTIASRLAWEVKKRYRHWRWNRAQRESRYVDHKVEGQAQLRLYTDSTLSWLIFNQGFEQKETTFVWRYLRPGDIFIDIGANIGLFTVIAAKRVGKGGMVYAFEPASLPRQRLEENVKLNQFRNVSIQPFALSDQEGWLELSIPTDGHDAWSSLAVPIAGTGIQTNRIKAVTWDDFAGGMDDLTPTMMKIDVEGWENRVLEGAINTLSSANAPLLQVEFTDAAAQAAGSSCAALYQHLLDLGYTVCRYDRDRNELISDGLRPSYPYDNLYATKHLDQDNRRLCPSR